MNVPGNTLKRGYEHYREEYLNRAQEVLDSGWYILGPQLTGFEQEFAAYIGSRYCVGCASGLDALVMAFRALHLPAGSGVLCQANTYIASVMGFTKNGLVPQFVEPDEYYELDPVKMEQAITPATRAVCIVHLYGQMANMPVIMEIAARHHLKVIEDCAQSHGASLAGRKCGSWGDIGCFSFYPTKNLGAFGDGGAIVTDHAEYAEEIRMLRNYGSKEHYKFETVGYNSRLDELQAGLLRVKLQHLEEIIASRRHMAQRYLEGIRNPEILLPKTRAEAESHVYHQFVIQTADRNRFMNDLKNRGIGSQIHYPEPPHLSEAYRDLGYHRGDFPVTEQMADHVVSLPDFDFMTEEELQYVIDAVNQYH